MHLPWSIRADTFRNHGMSSIYDNDNSPQQGNCKRSSAYPLHRTADAKETVLQCTILPVSNSVTLMFDQQNEEDMWLKDSTLYGALKWAIIRLVIALLEIIFLHKEGHITYTRTGQPHTHSANNWKKYRHNHINYDHWMPVNYDMTKVYKTFMIMLTNAVDSAAITDCINGTKLWQH